MFKNVNWFQRHFTAAREFLSGKPWRVRSSKWKCVESEFLKLHPSCAYCGGTTELQVHHVKPFHEYPELELDPSNLITLCMARGFSCHLRIGHLGNWRKINKIVRYICWMKNRK